MSAPPFSSGNRFSTPSRFSSGGRFSTPSRFSSGGRFGRPEEEEEEIGLEGAVQAMQEAEVAAAQEETKVPAPGGPRLSTGKAIMGELVKSYGFAPDPATGTWSWSADTIKQSFKDDPLWSTLDWLAVAFPPAKWATAIGRMKAGAKAIRAGKAPRSAVEAGLAAGRFEGKAPKSAMGRFMGNLFQDAEAAAAAEKAISGPSRLGFKRGGRLDRLSGGRLSALVPQGYFANPITTNIDRDYVKLIDEFGAAPFERRGLSAAMRREKMFAENVAKRRAFEIQRLLRRADLTSGRKAHPKSTVTEGEAFEMHVQGSLAAITRGGATEERLQAALSNPDVLARVRASFGEVGEEAWRRSLEFRFRTHMTLYELNLISDEAFQAGYSGPRIFEELERIAIEFGERSALGRAAGAGKRGVARLMHRTGREAKVKRPRGAPEEELEQLRRAAGVKDVRPKGDPLTRMFDPSITTDMMLEVAQIAARQEYMQRLARSSVALSADEVAPMAQKILNAARTGDMKTLAMNGVDLALANRIIRSADELDAAGQLSAEGVLRELGWRKADDFFRERGRAIPSYVERLPEELRGKLLDPAVARDLLGIAKVPDGAMKSLYRGLLNQFQFSKTVLNAATHFRNAFGAMVFHHLAVGGVPFAPPMDGFAALSAGLGKKTAALGKKVTKEAAEDYEDLVRTGHIVGTTWVDELHEPMGDALRLARPGQQRTGLDWVENFFGENKLTRFLTKSAGHAEQVYRGTDEVYKADAFIKLKRGMMKAGMSREEAVNAASLEVAKWMPTFSMHSPFTDAVRQVVPFASFTNEALRIWKNALFEKPHLAFFWNHFAETSSHAIAAANGFSQEELNAARESLPHFMQNKKMLMWPAKVDGKPMFLDLSYMVPMANITEAEDGEQLFFGELWNPFVSNPALSFGTAFATGIDPFSQRPIEPEVTERQLGIPVPTGPARKAVGLAEYAWKLFTPPAAPGNYVSTNVWELVSGAEHPISGEKLQESAWQTLAANFAGVRLYDATTESQILNVRHEARESQERIRDAWRRWSFAKANGDLETMKREAGNIVTLRSLTGDEDPLSYFQKGARRREPGAFRHLSTKQIEETLERTERAGALSERDKKIQSTLMSRYLARTE